MFAATPRRNQRVEEGPVHIPKGKVLGKRWQVVRKLGAGGCGAVYMVEDLESPGSHAAMKAESNFVAGGSVLKIEVDILKRLAGKDHVAQLLACGKRAEYQYMVMTLLGESLSNLLKRMSRCSISTMARIGLHVLHGLKLVHDIGIVHRDIKPANLVIGQAGTPEMRVIHVLDFGLSREFILNDENGQPHMRRPRKKALFRGTTRYCSVATHDRIEQGRCDDLWSLLYVMVECRGTLPWGHIRDKAEVAERKRRTPDQVLLERCPVQLLDWATYLRTQTYYTRPDYLKLFYLLQDIMRDGGYKMNDMWDWERSGLTSYLPFLSKEARGEPKKQQEAHTTEDKTQCNTKTDNTVTGSAEPCSSKEPTSPATTPKELIPEDDFKVNPFGF